MIPKWQDRPIVVANLLNPAFCGELLRLAIKAYSKEAQHGMPFGLLFLVLPLILKRQFRDRLPKSSSKKFYEWLEDNKDIQIQLAHQIKNIVPYTRESLLFLIRYEALIVNTQGNLEIINYRKKSLDYLNVSEIKELYQKSTMVGRWLSKVGNIKTVYTVIGIKP